MEVTKHAIQMFKKRISARYPVEKIPAKLNEMVQKGDEVRLKPEHRVNSILKYGEEARYFNRAGNVLVVVGDKIITVHDGRAKLWTPIPTRY